MDRAEFSAREPGLHNGPVCEYGGREVDNVHISIIYLMVLYNYGGEEGQIMWMNRNQHVL